MTTFIQLHILTAYPAANLNRDDTGRPKTVRIGEADRLRVSSQALKRAWRVAWRETDAFDGRVKELLADRTQRFGERVRAHLLGRGVPEDRALEIARDVAAEFGKPKPEGALTEQLAFIPPSEQAAALAAADAIAGGAKADEALKGVLGRADTAIDLALFGRMLADAPEFNREAAAQVAHAFTTHRAAVEDDYFTAVDDLQRPEEAAGSGAGHVGELGFGAGIFYLYACIDRDLLTRNLGGDGDLAGLAVASLVQAACTVSPRGKQASFASRARASYLLVEKGPAQPRTLAGAFFKPVRKDDPVLASVEALEEWRKSLDAAYGDAVPSVAMCALPGKARSSLAEAVAFARAP